MKDQPEEVVDAQLPGDAATTIGALASTSVQQVMVDQFGSALTQEQQVYCICKGQETQDMIGCDFC